MATSTAIFLTSPPQLRLSQIPTKPASDESWGGTAAEKSFEVAAYRVDWMKVREVGATDWTNDVVGVASGAIDSDVHKAEVLIQLVPPVQGKVKVQLTGGNGDTKNAKLVVGSATVNPGEPQEVDSNGSGQVQGKLTSSDKLERATISVGNQSADVEFAWNNYEEEDAWISSEEYIVPGVTSDETVTLKLNDKPLDGHNLKFEVTEICFIDENGETQVLIRDDTNASQIDELAYFENGGSAPATNSSGQTTITLHMTDTVDLVYLVMTYYDMSVNE